MNKKTGKILTLIAIIAIVFAYTAWPFSISAGGLGNSAGGFSSQSLTGVFKTFSIITQIVGYATILVGIIQMIDMMAGLGAAQCASVYHSGYGTCSRSALQYTHESDARFIDIFVEDPPSAKDFLENPSGLDRVALTWQSDANPGGPLIINYIEVEDITGSSLGGEDSTDREDLVYRSPLTVCDDALQTDAAHLRYGGTYRATIVMGNCNYNACEQPPPVIQELNVVTTVKKDVSSEFFAGSFFAMFDTGNYESFTSVPTCSNDEAATLEFTVPALPDLNVDLKANGSDILDPDWLGTDVTLSWTTEYADFCTFGMNPEITVSKATYAANCGAPTDCTTEASYKCDGKESCSYDHKMSGPVGEVLGKDYCPGYDPAYGCYKDMTVEYVCNGVSRTAYNGFADYNPTFLECPQGSLPLEGSMTVVPAASTARYTLTCTGPGHQYTPAPKQKSFYQVSAATTTVFDFGKEHTFGALKLDTIEANFMWKWEDGGTIGWHLGDAAIPAGKTGNIFQSLKDDGGNGVPGPSCPWYAGNEEAYEYCMSITDSVWDSDAKTLSLSWIGYTDRWLNYSDVPAYTGTVEGVPYTIPGFQAPVPLTTFRVAPYGLAIGSDFVDFTTLPPPPLPPPPTPIGESPVIRRFDIFPEPPFAPGDTIGFEWEADNAEYCRLETVVVPTEVPPEPLFDYAVEMGVPSVTMFASAGASATNTVIGTLLAGSTQFVSYIVSGLPQGVGILALPVFCPLSCKTNMKLTIGSSPPSPGTYPVMITGTAAKIERAASFILEIIPPPLPPSPPPCPCPLKIDPKTGESYCPAPDPKSGSCP